MLHVHYFSPNASSVELARSTLTRYRMGLKPMFRMNTTLLTTCKWILQTLLLSVVNDTRSSICFYLLKNKKTLQKKLEWYACRSHHIVGLLVGLCHSLWHKIASTFFMDNSETWYVWPSPTVSKCDAFSMQLQSHSAKLSVLEHTLA